MKAIVSTKVVAIASLILSSLTLVTVGFNSAVGSVEFIQGCVSKKSQLLRVANKCTKEETKIRWSIEGIQGDAGPIGPQGPKGDAGLQGAPGISAVSKVGTINYVVRIPVSFTEDANGGYVNILPAGGAGCSPGTLGVRIPGASLEVSNSTSGFTLYECSVSVLLP